jgi:hypothetical protein
MLITSEILIPFCSCKPSGTELEQTLKKGDRNVDQGRIGWGRPDHFHGVILCPGQRGARSLFRHLTVDSGAA